jgi:hypothetical protein
MPVANSTPVIMASLLCGMSGWGASTGHVWHLCARDDTLTAQCADNYMPSLRVQVLTRRML